MGLEALTCREDGSDAFPASIADWRQWVAASKTRSYVLGDPILDWLDQYGKDHGFLPDTEQEGYDRRTDFTELIFDLGHRFEEAAVALLAKQNDVVLIAATPEDIRSITKAEDTFKAMEAGQPIIHQGVLWDAQHQTYGAPDLLVRSDVLTHLFPDALSQKDAAVAAPHLRNAHWHYRVVDVKFTTLHFNAAGQLGNEGSGPAYKVQVYIYNRALGRIQGFESPASYVLGRSWQKGSGKTLQRGFSALDRVAPILQSGTVANGRLIADLAEESVAWIRRVRTEGARWRVLPQPSLPELYPNMNHHQDGPFHRAKRKIAEEIEDVTLLWEVGPPGRARAHASGVFRWRDPACTPAAVGVDGPVERPMLEAILDVNRSNDGAPVRPARIQKVGPEWRVPAPVEFFVDFETVNDLYDDFTRMPRRGGQPLIFMIGCGHMEEGQWKFECFVVDRLTEEHEARIIDDWFAHMEAVRQRIDPKGGPPTVIHWSPAERITLESAYNSAKERHIGNTWPSPAWFDFYNKVMKAEPVVVNGALEFGLKSVARALRSHNLITTTWADGPADGLGAMVGAWRCEGEAAARGGRLIETELMREIRGYNEVDCKVMMEAIDYLRAHH